MRTVNDFANALQVLLGQATTQCSAEQLEAVGNLLMALGGAAQATAAIKRATGSSVNLSQLFGVAMQGGTPASAFAGGPGSPQPASGAFGPPSSSAPAPAPTRMPQYTPPPPDVQCEEAHHQRTDPSRIAALRDNPVAFVERVLYYLTQIGAVAKQVPEGEDLRGAKIDECMLSIECLPGQRPPGGEPEELSQVWSITYAVLKDLIKREVLDADDEQQVLFKMGDRPGGAMAPPDYSNENIAPPPKPGQVVVTAVQPPPPPPPATATATAPGPGPGPEPVKFGNEFIDFPKDQGHVPPPSPLGPPATPAKPMTVKPGDVVFQPYQVIGVRCADGVSRDFENQLNRTIAVSPDEIAAVLAGEQLVHLRLAAAADPA